MDKTLRVPARRLAHGRTGDKGDRCSISVIAYRPEFYPVLAEQLTEAKVRQCFEHRQPTGVTRYLLPKLGAMNFVIDGVLDGGVNDSLNLDSHGKALSFLLLSLEVQVPPSWLALLAGDDPITDDDVRARGG
ncbi:MAG: hypothetical protein ACLGHY_01080 [Gammaproteobacteria bacterium]